MKRVHIVLAQEDVEQLIKEESKEAVEDMAKCLVKSLRDNFKVPDNILIEIHDSEKLKKGYIGIQIGNWRISRRIFDNNISEYIMNVIVNSTIMFGELYGARYK